MQNVAVPQSELSGSAIKVTPLSRLVELRAKGLTYKEIGAITGDSEAAITKRFSRHDIDSQELMDYSDVKALAHESLQFRLHKSMSEAKIKKMAGGSTVLAICQLEDKIRLIRNQSTANLGIDARMSAIDQSAEQNQAIIAKLAAELGVEIGEAGS